MTVLREICMLYMYDTLHVLKHVHNSHTLVVYIVCRLKLSDKEMPKIFNEMTFYTVISRRCLSKYTHVD